MTMALAEQPFTVSSRTVLTDDEAALVAGICNRISRMIGLSDREGLQQDFAIVQSANPIDLEALLESPDDVLVQELLRLIEHTDRASGTLSSGYRTRFSKSGGPRPVY